MGMSEYLQQLRRCVGKDTLLVPAAAGCIRDEEGRILLVRRSDEDGLWGFPGGAMEPGESAGQAMVREVSEETGLEVEPVALIGVYSSPDFAFSFPNGDRVQAVSSFFECRVVGGSLRPDMEETLELRFFGPDERPGCAPLVWLVFRMPSSMGGRLSSIRLVLAFIRGGRDGSAREV